MYDVIIIGGGVAGMTAALNVARAGMTALILEGNSYGGQIAFASRVENIPSIESISGTEFADRLLSQAISHGCDTEFENVTGIINRGNVKEIITEDSRYECKAVIIATGMKHRHLSLPKEDELCANGVSYCAVCDGAFYKGKTVAVIGGGETAVCDSIYLSDICKKVYLIHRRDVFRAQEQNVGEMRAKKNVECILSAEIASLNGDESLTGITVKTNDGTLADIEADGLFVAIGKIPNTEVFKGIISLDGDGFIETDEDCLTNIPGLFAAGDCRRKTLRQLTTAAADGAIAAYSACRYISSL